LSFAQSWYVTTFYYFTDLNDLDFHQSKWENKAKELNLLGLLILGPEGFNTTCCAPSEEALGQFKNWVVESYNCPQIHFKDSISALAPFIRYKVKQRPEIVTLHTPEYRPNNQPYKHLSPDQWNQVLKTESDAVIIDTRNWYEYRIGSFERAINPNIDKFTEFPEWFEKQGINKDQKILIFCTGGVRCEKGIFELQAQGYQNVFQLDGGIINYIKAHPHDQFWGECFVFDHRVALNQNLMPSTQYKLCPHCGQPAEVVQTCQRCEAQFLICPDCHKDLFLTQVCSKNCAYHFKLNPGKKGRQQLRLWEKMVQHV